MDRFPPGSAKTLTITEGELDAISLWQVIRSPVVSVQSSSSAVRDLALVRSYLAAFDRVILAFDDDAAGREAAGRVAKLFEFGKVYDVRFGRLKDANAYVEASQDAELGTIWRNAKRYLPDTITSSLDEFKELLATEPSFGVPYPFPTLTEMTYGIRPGEIVLITAQEGVGKTSLMHAIEHRLLKETKANVGVFHLEETRRQLLESLVGIELGQPIHLPGSGVSADSKSDALEALLEKDDRLFVYNSGHPGDPDLFLDHIRFLVAGCGVQFICFDLVSMVVGGDPTEDKRKLIDYFMMKLEMMVVELGFSAIIVCHVNDDGQTRDSRYVGKAAAVRIDLSRNLSVGETRTHVTVSKNRYASKTGPAGVLEFDPFSYILKEVPREQLDVELNIELANLVKGLAANDNGFESVPQQVA